MGSLCGNWELTRKINRGLSSCKDVFDLLSLDLYSLERRKSRLNVK